MTLYFYERPLRHVLSHKITKLGLKIQLSISIKISFFLLKNFTISVKILFQTHNIPEDTPVEITLISM